MFPYPNATLGIRVPAWSWSETAWVMDYLPIEEFGFYSLGALFMLMIYIWADQEWLRDYHPSTYKCKAQNVRQLVSFHP